MSFESDEERRALAEAWGDWLTFGAIQVPGQYEAPRAEALLLEGNIPHFMALASDLAAAGIAVGSTSLNVTRHDGATFGPYKAVNAPESSDDGIFLTLGLELQ